MAVNVNAGVLQPIQFALTTGKNKTPISAENLTRVKLVLLNRSTLFVLHTLDSNTTPGIFFWNRTSQTVKGIVDIFLLEMELEDQSLVIQDDMIARLTLYDVINPAGLSWKQFALNSRS